MVVQAAASKCEIFASTYKCVCWCAFVYVCVFANSGPLFCQQHTGAAFMTDCNSEGCVVDPHLLKHFSSVAWQLSEILEFVLILQRDVCPVSVGASWIFNVIAGKWGRNPCLCVSDCIHLKEKK